MPHFPNTMYLLYKQIHCIRKILGKWGIVHKGVYFTTKHVKRVHIRCRCTFFDKIEEEKILDPSACGIYKPMVILRVYFILPLVLYSHIQHAVVSITTMLQMISCDLIEALSECQTLIRHFETEKCHQCVQHLI